MSVRVVAAPLAHLSTVALVAALRGGPRFEGPRENGLTHLMEHVVFRGTRKHPSARELLSAFEAIGDEPDAHTGDDEIVVSATLLPDSVPQGARLVAEVLLEPLWKDLERERRIVLEERLEFVDDRGQPSDLDDIARRLVFAGHPLGRSLTGEERDVRRFKRPDLERHRRRLVRDGNLVVAVAGPIGPAELRAVKRAFAAVPAGPGPRDVSIPDLRGPVTSLVRSRGAGQCEVRFTFMAPGESDARMPVLRLLAAVLDGGATARLPERLVDPGFLYDAHVALVPFPDRSLLEVDLAVSRDGLVKAVERALAVVSSIAQGLDESELAQARARILVRRAFARDDAHGEAEWHARRALFGHSVDRSEELAGLEAVTAKDVVALAREVISPARFALVLLGDPSREERARVDRVVRKWVGRVG